MELVELVTKYPAGAIVFVAWPLAFVWLLKWTMQQSAKREDRLMLANEEWRKALELLTNKMDLTALERVEQKVERLLEMMRAWRNE